jgi:hypothetical protein
MIGILVTTLCVVMQAGRSASQVDAERPACIPLETGGTSINYQDLVDKTLVFCKISLDGLMYTGERVFLSRRDA